MYIEMREVKHERIRRERINEQIKLHKWTY